MRNHQEPRAACKVGLDSLQAVPVVQGAVKLIEDGEPAPKKQEEGCLQQLGLPI